MHSEHNPYVLCSHIFHRKITKGKWRIVATELTRLSSFPNSIFHFYNVACGEYVVKKLGKPIQQRREWSDSLHRECNDNVIDNVVGIEWRVVWRREGKEEERYI
jgi:hypothetical protein